MPLPCLRRTPAWLASALLCLSAAVHTAAQDVTISNPEWAEPLYAPDELPAMKHRPHIGFPDELKKTSEIGYVVVEAVLDEKGKRLGWRELPTNPLYLTAIDPTDTQRFRFGPAKREGQPVISEVTFALVFNPASAAVDRPDATPRLLAVTAAHVQAPQGHKGAIPDAIIPAEVRVDEQGGVVAVENVPAELAEALRTTAKNWRFAPARAAGKPVAATVHVPFIVVTENRSLKARGERIQPRAIFRAPPVYPYALRASGLRGEVLVDFVVTIEGRVRNAYIVRSLNPAFDDPALEAVAKWRFKPGVVDGVPVNTHMQVPIIFQLNDTPGGGDDGMEVRHRADLSKLPPQFRYDVEPRLRASVRPVYPYAALAAKRSGRAVVNYLVDAQGRVAQATVREATSPEFGAALLAAVSEFQYTPAVKDGHPSLALLAFEQKFSREEMDGVITDADLDVLNRELKRPQTLVPANQLDHPLKPLSRRPPVFPPTLIGKVDQGEAMIDFIIDDEGRARLPRVVTATNEAFGYAAAQAIAAWRFERPTRGGHAVMTRVRIPVAFAMSPEAASSKPPVSAAP